MRVAKGVLLSVAAMLILPACMFFRAEAAVEISREMADGVIDRVLVENEFIGVEIDSLGGKATRLYDRRSGREFVAPTGNLMQGFFKQREWNTGNAELLMARYKLIVAEESPGRVEIEAEYEAITGNFNGLMFRKTYVVSEGTAYLKVKQEVVSVKEENYFTLNIHNLLPLEGFPDDSSYFYASSTDGPVKFSVTEARLKGNNLVYNIAEPWSAIVNRESREGLAFIMRDRVELDNLYFWTGTEQCTLEWAYGTRKLSPMAEADRWQTEFYVMPLKGLKSVHGGEPDLLYSVETGNGRTVLGMYPGVSLGEAEVRVSHGGREQAVKDVKLSAGEAVSLEFAAPAARGITDIEFALETAQRKIVFSAPAAAGVEMAYAKPTHEIVRRDVEETGIHGFYYYFRSFNVSPDITVPVAFGLRGNFRNRRNFRLVLEVPEGIILNSEFPEEVKKTDVEIDGEKYVRHEFTRTRVATYYSAITLFASSRLEEPAEGLRMHYYAEWDGGKQLKETLPLNIVRIARPPELKKILVGLELSGRRRVEAYPDLGEGFRNAGLNYVGGGIAGWTLSTGKHLGAGAYSDPVSSK